MSLVIIIIVVVVAFLLFYKNKRERNIFTDMENELHKEMKGLLFEGKSYEEHIELVASIMFSISLKKAGKRLTGSEMMKPSTLVRNMEVLNYISLYKSLKDTLEQVPNLVKYYGYGNDKDKIVQQVINSIMPFTISKLLKLKDI